METLKSKPGMELSVLVRSQLGKPHRDVTNKEDKLGAEVQRDDESAAKTARLNHVWSLEPTKEKSAAKTAQTEKTEEDAAVEKTKVRAKKSAKMKAGETTGELIKAETAAVEDGFLKPSKNESAVKDAETDKPRPVLDARAKVNVEKNESNVELETKIEEFDCLLKELQDDVRAEEKLVETMEKARLAREAATEEVSADAKANESAEIEKEVADKAKAEVKAASEKVSIEARATKLAELKLEITKARLNPVGTEKAVVNVIGVD